jgi:hypothetical protein
MKNRLLFSAALLVLMLQTAIAQSQQLTVQNGSGKPTVLTRADLEALPHVKVTTSTSGMSKSGTLPEIDSAFTDKPIILAFLKDGKSLDDKEGPYRIVIPDEKRMARWVRQVTALKVVDVQ